MIWIKLLLVAFVICFHLSSVASLHCISCYGTTDCIVNPPKETSECQIQPTWKYRKCILILPTNKEKKDFARSCFASIDVVHSGCKFYAKEIVQNLHTPAVLCTCESERCNGKGYNEDGTDWPKDGAPAPGPGGTPGGGGKPPGNDTIINPNQTAFANNENDGGAFIGPKPIPITILLLTSIVICLLGKIMNN